MKSGIQMMFESMIGEQGLKAVEECKRILPAVPQLVQNIKEEWETMRREQQKQMQLLERIATQNNLILGRLESLEFKVDPNKTEELPPTLAHHLSVTENAERFTSNGIDSNGNHHA